MKKAAAPDYQTVRQAIADILDVEGYDDGRRQSHPAHCANTPLTCVLYLDRLEIDCQHENFPKATSASQTVKEVVQE